MNNIEYIKTYYIPKHKLNKNNITTNKPYTFIELCAGCGGLSSGFIKAGFNPLLLNDNNKLCCDTLKANHKTIPVFQGDMNDVIKTMKNLDIKNIDVLMAGVPCQSFSLAGKCEGLKDKRGNLLLEFIDLISIIKPKVFLIENVKGLLLHDKGKTIEYVLNKLKKINYNVYYQILNANDYEVPQKRERLFIVGVHKNINKTYKFPPKYKYKPILKDVLLNVPKCEGMIYNNYKKNIMKKIPAGGCWINLSVKLQKEYLGNSYYSGGGKRGIARRLDMNEPSLTLLTSPSQKQTERCHPIETRPLNIIEYARIQTFPDTYIFKGGLMSKYKQIGNAVPVNLAFHMAQSIRNVLN